MPLSLWAGTRALGESTVAFQSYTLFFTHADNICFYAGSQAFNERSERAVNALYTVSVDIADELSNMHRDSKDMQQELLQNFDEVRNFSTIPDDVRISSNLRSVIDLRRRSVWQNISSSCQSRLMSDSRSWLPTQIELHPRKTVCKRAKTSCTCWYGVDNERSVLASGPIVSRSDWRCRVSDVECSHHSQHRGSDQCCGH